MLYSKKEKDFNNTSVKTTCSAAVLITKSMSSEWEFSSTFKGISLLFIYSFGCNELYNQTKFSINEYLNPKVINDQAITHHLIT